VNGTETNAVQIDTSQAATDTIEYVATDQSGLASTSTRRVIVEAPANDNSPPLDVNGVVSASSTAGTSSTQ